jgi:hypothetical protein
MRQTREELEQERDRVDHEYAGRSQYAAELARLPHQNELAAIQNRYGRDLDAYSHGESF